MRTRRNTLGYRRGFHRYVLTPIHTCSTIAGMCDWPVYGGFRGCDRNGSFNAGPMSLCSTHFEVLFSGVIEELRREGHHVTHGFAAGHYESIMRDALRDIALGRRNQSHLKRQDEYADQARSPSIYFALREGWVKIGTTLNVAERMRALAGGGQMLEGMTAGPLTLLASVPGGVDKEKSLHRRFRHLRVDPKREWFVYAGSLRDFIEELRTA